MTTFPNVADLSSAQRSFDAAAYAASGRRAVIIKSTESTTYHFVTGDTWELQARQHDLAVGRYHWAGSSLRGTIQAPDVEGDYFLRHNGDHTPGRFAACDMENPLPGHGPALYGMSPANAALWVDEFLDHIAAKGGWPGLGYSFSGSGVVQRIRHAKWPASYPKLTIPDAALHQFSSSAPVPGVGNCDDSHCFIDLRVFAGATPTPPSFHPSGGQEDSTMALVTGPTGSRVDLVVVGLPDPAADPPYPAGSGPVYHAFANSVADLLSVKEWEPLGGYAHAVSAGWTADGSTFVVSALGVDGHVWLKTWDAAHKWTPWQLQVSGNVLVPAVAG